MTIEQQLYNLLSLPASMSTNARIEQIIRTLQAGSPITNASYQAWIETLPGYDADADDLAVVRMADGSFQCRIVNIQQ